MQHTQQCKATYVSLIYACHECYTGMLFCGVDKHVDICGIQNPAGFLDQKAVKAALQRARVVFTTCAGAGSSQIALQQYALVIIDEASQVAELATLFQSKQPDIYQNCTSSFLSLAMQNHVSYGFVSTQHNFKHACYSSAHQHVMLPVHLVYGHYLPGCFAMSIITHLYPHYWMHAMYGDVQALSLLCMAQSDKLFCR